MTREAPHRAAYGLAALLLAAPAWAEQAALEEGFAAMLQAGGRAHRSRARIGNPRPFLRMRLQAMLKTLRSQER